MPTLTTNYSLKKPNVNAADDEDLWGGQLNDSMDLIDAQMKVNADGVASSGAPIGSPLPYFGSSAPTNHLLCYGETIGDVASGADLESADYEALFDIAKNCAPNAGTEVFSTGGTVVIPDMRGYVPAGKDNMGGVSANRLTDQSGGVDGDVLGDTGGAETHTLVVSELAAHTHSVSGASNSAGGSARARLTDAAESDTFNTATTGGDGAHNNVQPTIVLNYIVRYK